MCDNAFLMITDSFRQADEINFRYCYLTRFGTLRGDRFETCVVRLSASVTDGRRRIQFNIHLHQINGASRIHRQPNWQEFSHYYSLFRRRSAETWINISVTAQIHFLTPSNRIRWNGSMGNIFFFSFFFFWFPLHSRMASIIIRWMRRKQHSIRSFRSFFLFLLKSQHVQQSRCSFGWMPAAFCNPRKRRAHCNCEINPETRPRKMN